MSVSANAGDERPDTDPHVDSGDPLATDSIGLEPGITVTPARARSAAFFAANDMVVATSPKSGCCDHR